MHARKSLRESVGAWVAPFRGPLGVVGAAKNYLWFLRDWRRFRRMPGGEAASWRLARPILDDRTEKSPFDHHYFYQDNWAIRRVVETKPSRHVDVGSRVDTVSHMGACVPTTFVDIRPLEAEVDGLTCIGGSILEMPYADGEVESLSCLHVAEHIGLGRYGDPLDPDGTRKAASELARVLKRGGNLFFSLPVGVERVEFNAHRVHAPETILRYFEGLELVEFSGVDDEGRFRRRIRPADLAGCRYACGMFWFRKP